jgi:oligopeptide transport system substrate-binding protein
MGLFNKRIILFLSIVFFFTTCKQKIKEERSEEANGGVFYGGVFKINELDDFKNLFPLSILDVVSFRIASQCYEGLVRFDQADLKIIPAIADSWKSNDDNTIWTFKLRNNVFFHDDSCFTNQKGRLLNANDIKYCFDKLCQFHPLNSFYEITFKDKVVGANEAFEKSKLSGKSESVSGIKVINDSTLTIQLLSPNPDFTNILATPGCYIYPKEAFDNYGENLRSHCVGTGPFFAKTIKEGKIVVLEKNPNYWKIDKYGNKLPYLDAIKFSFIKEKKSEMIEFKKGNLDMVFRIPVEMYKDVMGNYQNAQAKVHDFDVQSTPALSVDFYTMLTLHPAFNKKEVRLAFNHAIDKNKIIDFTLQGQGVVGKYGVIPPLDIFRKNGLNFDEIKGNEFDVEKARDLMKVAGYPGGKGFPEIILTINSGGGERNQQIAEVIQKMLSENIGVKLSINVVQFPEQIELRSTGKAYFTRGSWSADYPDPASFLDLFYGKNVPAENEKSYINSARFKNDEFDKKYEAALHENDKAKRYTLFKECDQILINEGALLNIYYNENDRLVQKRVRNFPINAMEYRDLSVVYFVPEKSEKK